MKTQRVYVEHTFPAPVAKVFAALAEHENLALLFAPAKVTRLRDGWSERNGVGSARKLSIPLTPPFVETTQVYRENEVIEYAITSGISPIKDHYGVMKFSDIGGNQTKLEYTIEFKGRVPVIGPVVKVVLQNAIGQGLKKLRV